MTTTRLPHDFKGFLQLLNFHEDKCLLGGGCVAWLRRALPLALLLALLFPLSAHAEGPLSGGTRVYLADEPVGALTVTSFAAPNPPVTTDRLWVTVQLRDGARAVTDAEVWVAVSPRAGGPPERAMATHELAATPLDYTAALPVVEQGSYDVRIEVHHDKGTGTVNYVLHVSEPLTKYILAFTVVPFLVFALFLVRYFWKRLGAGQEHVLQSDEPVQEAP